MRERIFYPLWLSSIWQYFISIARFFLLYRICILVFTRIFIVIYFYFCWPYIINHNAFRRATDHVILSFYYLRDRVVIDAIIASTILLGVWVQIRKPDSSAFQSPSPTARPVYLPRVREHLGPTSHRVLNWHTFRIRTHWPVLSRGASRGRKLFLVYLCYQGTPSETSPFRTSIFEYKCFKPTFVPLYPTKCNEVRAGHSFDTQSIWRNLGWLPETFLEFSFWTYFNSLIQLAALAEIFYKRSARVRTNVDRGLCQDQTPLQADGLYVFKVRAAAEYRN